MAWTTDNRIKTLVFKAAVIATSGSPADIASVSLPKDVARWLPRSITVRAVGASGTLVAAAINVRTAVNGAGSPLMSSPLSLSSLNGTADRLESASMATFTTALSATALHLRQTADSVNAGTITVVVEYLDLT